MGEILKIIYIKLSLCIGFLFLNKQNKKLLRISWNTSRSVLGSKHTVILVCYLFQVHAGRINKCH